MRTTRLRQPDGSRWGSQRIRPSAPSASFARRHRLYTRYTATGRRSSPTCCAHSRGECILFIWGPNFEMLPAAHRTLGSTQPLAGQTLKNEPAEVRGSCTGWREQNLALCCQRLVRRASLAVLDTLRPVGVASPHAVLTPWGNASSLSGGRILKCFPPPIALSAARNRWRAKLSKMNPLRCGAPARVGSKQNSALCSQCLVRRASLAVLDTLRPCAGELRNRSTCRSKTFLVPGALIGLAPGGR